MARSIVSSRHRARCLPAILGVTCWLAISQTAAATDCSPPTLLSSCIDADAYWPHFGAGRFATIGATETTAPHQAGFGLALSYSSRPIILRTSGPNLEGNEIVAIDDLFDATFLWSFGVSERLEVGAAVGTTLHRSGTGIDALALERPPGLSKTAMRDARVGAAYALLPRARVLPDSAGTGATATTSPFAATARFDLVLPTGDESSFAGDASFVAVPAVDADFRYDRFFVAAELGARLRATNDLLGTRVGPQLVTALGAGVDILSKELLSLQVEAFALPTLVEQRTASRDPVSLAITEAPSDGPSLIPAEWMASLRSAPVRGGDFSVVLGGGAPLTSSGSLTTPRFRTTLALRYAPLARDSDGDGVLDRTDQCPDVPEDRDGFEDEDGCPDPDNDHDGIPDSRDRCRDEAETVDGFEDDDGCPDLDDDHDGVPDEVDKCRMVPEDKDGFQDEDGCPDLDNDLDGIPDTADKCPNTPEDKDGYQDQDGCPDPDNDLDGIPDTADKCPNEPEDKDGFEDEDGCPDPDNDHDGILDAADKCPLEPETIDGHDDADGCPEPGAKSRVSWNGDKVVLDAPHRFAVGNARLTPALELEVAMIAQLARGRTTGRIVVQAYADGPGDTAPNQKLASARADALRAAFIKAGAPADRLTAIAGDLAERRPTGAPPFDVEVTPPAKR